MPEHPPPIQFNFQAQAIRIIILDGEPWFVATDVADILHLANPRSSLALLDVDEKGVHAIDTPGGTQSKTIISESGLYNLIFRSRRPEANTFRRWVTNEILPTIRRTGQYTLTPATQPAPAIPQTLSEALRLAADLAEEREALAQQNAILTPKAQAFDALMDADGTYSVGNAAKVIGWGQNRLFQRLRDDRVLMDAGRNGTENHNIPYQRFIDAGYFRVITRARPAGENEERGKITRTTRITARGLQWLRERLARPAHALPPTG